MRLSPQRATAPAPFKITRAAGRCPAAFLGHSSCKRDQTAKNPSPKTQNPYLYPRRPNPAIPLAEPTLHTIPAEGPAIIARDIRNSGFLKIRWLYHILFWVGYYGLTITLYLSLREHFTTAGYITTAMMILIQSGFYYLNTYLLMPRFLFSRKYGYYILTFIASLALCPLLTSLSQQAYAIGIEHIPSAKL